MSREYKAKMPNRDASDSSILDTQKRDTVNLGVVNKNTAKRERYLWSAPSEPGSFRRIPKTELQIDGSYQRTPAKRKVMAIAREWDWRLFGAITVVQRANESLWVIDGGHRVNAAFLRDDVDTLPCMLFLADGVQGEARTFLGCNTLVSNVGVLEKHRAALKAGEPTAMAIEAIASSHGYCVAEPKSTAQTHGMFLAVGCLRRLVESKSAQIADRAFALCSEIASGGYFPATLLDGVGVLLNKFKNTPNILTEHNLDKLRSAGIDICLHGIRTARVIEGKGGGTVYAKALLGIINKNKKHNRITW